MDPDQTVESEPVVPERFQQVLRGEHVVCLKEHCRYPMVIDVAAYEQMAVQIRTWQRGYPGAPIPARLLRLVMRCFSNGHQEVWHAVQPEIRLERPQLSTERVEMECGCGKLFITNGKATQCAACRGRATRLWERMGAIGTGVPHEESVGASA